jgi:hypothetical protein
MSVRTMARVWDCSRHGGTELLMLLAIADFADDEGRAYPSVGTLADKCRMSPRNANMLLARLRESGELEISIGTGPRGTNSYRIRLQAAPLKAASPLKPASSPEAPFTPETAFTLKPASPTPEAGFPRPLKPASDEPSLNYQEPPESPLPTSREPVASDPSVPRCPHSQLLALFAEKVPDLPKPRAELWTGSDGAKNLAARWRWVLTAKRENGRRYATTSDEALEWFGRFFGAVASSDFLTGRNDRWKGCNLQWLVKASNFAKVVDGNYSREDAAA